MRRTPVFSSNLLSIGYDADQHILEVEFLDGSVYQYFEVLGQVYDGLMNAGSHGTYFHQHIRTSYEYRQVL